MKRVNVNLGKLGTATKPDVSWLKRRWGQNECWSLYNQSLFLFTLSSTSAFPKLWSADP